ncbi:ferredoxin [Clostridium botulinum]|nr:ferredoxin [Clostridium botulinum]
MKAYVNQDTCVGCGLCPSICSEVFEMREDGKAYVIEEDIKEEVVHSAEEARDSCPVAAIDVK